MKKLCIILNVSIFLIFSLSGVNPTFHKAKCQQRWAKVMYTHAQVEPDPTQQNRLFKCAAQCTRQSDATFNKVRIRYPKSTQKEFICNEKLLKRIKGSTKHADRTDNVLARKAAIHKVAAQHFVKEHTQLAEIILALENHINTPRSSRMLFLKKLNADNEEAIHELKIQKSLVLKKAEQHFYKAAHLYVQAYGISQKSSYKKRAEKILTKHIYDLEVEQIAQSQIFTISKEKTNLLKELYS